MLKIRYPSISVVIPAYNAEKHINSCLRAIKRQDYPQNKIEIILIDDKSTDRTVKISKRYTKRVYHSGKHFCEYSKSLGIQKAKNELILLLDSDNILPHKSFLRGLVKPLINNEKIVASYPIYFNYDEKDSLMDRYCSLFGINDPYQFYLKKRDRLMITETAWNLEGSVVKKHKDYFHIRFKKGEKLTLGTIAFLVRKDVLKKSNYKPHFFHIDSLIELINKGYTDYAMVKQPIIHKHSDSLKHFLKKLYRNAVLFFKYGHLRKNSWAVDNKKSFILKTLVLLSVVIPFYHSLKGYFKKKDVAWFVHPLVCFTVPFLYLSVYFKKLFGVLK